LPHIISLIDLVVPGTAKLNIMDCLQHIQQVPPHNPDCMSSISISCMFRFRGTRIKQPLTSVVAIQHSRLFVAKSIDPDIEAATQLELVFCTFIDVQRQGVDLADIAQ
jgi:hypothetical protein